MIYAERCCTIMASQLLTDVQVETLPSDDLVIHWRPGTTATMLTEVTGINSPEIKQVHGPVTVRLSGTLVGWASD
jgi:hypothetical protein